MHSAPYARTMTARSVILSALIGFDGDSAAVGGILAFTNELGLQESAVRAALSRLSAAGELERTNGRYKLCPRLRSLQLRQEQAIHPTIKPWEDDQWNMVVVTRRADSPNQRVGFRDEMRFSRFRELREGVWARPNNIEFVISSDVSRRVSMFRAVPDEPSRTLSERLYQPESWSSTAQSLMSNLSVSKSVAQRFEVAATIARHLLADPVLPIELLPCDWPGIELRQAYESIRVEMTSLATHHLAATGL
jgi:phenylacetic acid degradation operon negative regulatory protein